MAVAYVAYGWWPNLVYTFGFRIFWILLDFWFFKPDFGVGSGLISLIMVLGFKTPESQPGNFNIGSFSIDFQDFGTFFQKWAWPRSTVFIGFAARSAKIRKCWFSRPDRKVARWKTMQIDGGFIPRSLFFDLVMADQDSQFSTIFVSLQSYPPLTPSIQVYTKFVRQPYVRITFCRT